MGRVVQINDDGTFNHAIVNITRAAGVAVDPISGQLFVSTAGFTDKIYAVDPIAKTATLFRGGGVLNGTDGLGHFSPIPTKFRRNLWWQNNLTGVRPNRERQPSVRPRSQAFPGSSQRKTRDNPDSAACSGSVQACSLLCTAVGMSEKCPATPRHLGLAVFTYHMPMDEADSDETRGRLRMLGEMLPRALFRTEAIQQEEG